MKDGACDLRRPAEGRVGQDDDRGQPRGRLLARGQSVALLDTDPQGSLGRWFMARRALGGEDLGFSTASAWGVSYECDKLRRKSFDFVIVDTPPKVDADLRPALREADLVIVPVSASRWTSGRPRACSTSPSARGGR
jgi:cellulose biosynthesis protein BcsQ